MLLASRRKLTRVDEDVMIGKFRVFLSSVFFCTLSNHFPGENNNNNTVAGVVTQKIKVDVRGEILELNENVNGMPESLSVLADEMTREAKVETEEREGDECWWNLRI